MIIEPAGPLVGRVTEALRLRRSGEKVALVLDQDLDIVLGNWLAGGTDSATSRPGYGKVCGWSWVTAPGEWGTEVRCGCVRGPGHTGPHVTPSGRTMPNESDPPAAEVECGYLWRIILEQGPTNVSCVLPNRHVGDHEDDAGHRIERWARLNPQDPGAQQLDREVWDYLASMVSDWRMRGSIWSQRALKLLAKLQERP